MRLIELCRIAFFGYTVAIHLDSNGRITAVILEKNMFDNILLITIVIIIMWLGMLIFYLSTSRQQGNLQQSLESLRRQLDKSEHRES